jgi:GLPGLI family protein
MKIKCFFFFVFISFLANCQENFTSARIEYEMIFLTESYNSTLIYNNDKAEFSYFNDEISETKTDDNGNINITVADTIPHRVLTDNLTKKLHHYTCIYSVKKHDWIEEVLPSFNWVLIEESKKIGNLECYKATCSFRGRNYIAWYSTEIKTFFGPWKFSGLPGLILEIHDSENKVNFFAKKISIPFKDQIKLFPFNTIAFEKVKEIQKAETDQLIKNIESKQERGFKVKIKVNTKEQIEKD